MTVGQKIALIVAAALFAIVGLSLWPKPEDSISREYPEYLSFTGNYVFPILKNNQVDVESVPGVELLYAGKISAKTLDDIYNTAGISLQPISELPDSSGQSFKNYVNNTFLAQIKTNLSTDDVRTTFDKKSGWDIAKVVVRKDSNQIRFIYLKNGQHPVAVVAKEETDAVKKIEAAVIDVEQSDLKEEVEPIKQTLKATTQLIKDQKAHELYQAGAPELRAQSSEKELTDSFKAATPFIKGEITINGVSYSPGEFSAVLMFDLSSAKDAPRAYSTLNFKKVDGRQWKLKGLTLPTIAAPAKKL